MARLASEYREEARVWRNLAENFATFQQRDAASGFYPSLKDARRSTGLCYTVERLAYDGARDDPTTTTLRKSNGVRRQAVADLVEARLNAHCEAHETCRGAYVFGCDREGDDARALFCLLMEQEALDDATAVQ